MVPIMERVAGFTQKKPTPVQRGGASYAATYTVCARTLRICVWTYRRLKVEDQTARLIRDIIDFTLRRYHGYAIKENFGAHYRERDLSKSTKTEFEHVIPAAVARDLLLFGRMTIDEALNIPTCTLSKANHKKLNSTGHVSTTPNIGWFWQRYQSLSIEIETHDGTPVDMSTWNLQTHYEYFGNNTKIT